MGSLSVILSFKFIESIFMGGAYLKVILEFYWLCYYCWKITYGVSKSNKKMKSSWIDNGPSVALWVYEDNIYAINDVINQ